LGLRRGKGARYFEDAIVNLAAGASFGGKETILVRVIGAIANGCCLLKRLRDEQKR
jgi:hypothetical protein